MSEAVDQRHEPDAGGAARADQCLDLRLGERLRRDHLGMTFEPVAVIDLKNQGVHALAGQVLRHKNQEVIERRGRQAAEHQRPHRQFAQLGVGGGRGDPARAPRWQGEG